MSQKTWGGRFTGGTDKQVEAFTESISFDRRLFPQDIRGSQAHATMLGEVGILTPEEAKKICSTLDKIGERIAAGGMEFTTSLEDIHTHIEKALIEELGDLGRKLHAGRSRNDQVVTDVKLWARDSIDDLDALLANLQKAFLLSAIRERDVIIPGYTHLQRAQPVLAGHYFLAYVEKFARDRSRLIDCRKRLNALPLGAAALAGSTLPLNRDRVRELLQFDSLARNSLDVSSDRDFLAELLFVLSLVATHLSGWAEEWIIWSTTEFNFLILPDAFCTGSSIMPHKKNPDVLELTRGKSAKVIGNLQQILVLLKGLPLAYNRDLQEDKQALFEAVDTVTGMLSVAAPLVEQTRLNQKSIASRIEDGFLDATALMEAFVAAGLPMRSAHEAVGKLVKTCEDKQCRLADLPAMDFENACVGFGAKRESILGVKNAVNAYKTFGSSAPSEVQKQIEFWKNELGVDL